MSVSGLFIWPHKERTHTVYTYNVACFVKVDPVVCVLTLTSAMQVTWKVVTAVLRISVGSWAKEE